MTSVYRWQGKVERAQEWQCMIKTRQDLLDDVSEAIREIHPYEVPEIIAVPIVAGNGASVFQPRKEVPTPGFSSGSSLLQWGLRFSAEEGANSKGGMTGIE